MSDDDAPNDDVANYDVTGDYVIVIACGGKSERLGADKNALLLGDARLIDRAVRNAARPNVPLALAVRDDTQSRHIDLPLLIDSDPSIGPIAALLSAFHFAAAHDCAFALLLASDQPFLPRDLPEKLFAHIGQHGCAVPNSLGRDQYMASLWSVRPAALEAYIAQGGRSLWQYAQSVGLARLLWEAGGEDPFADIDDLTQLAAARARIVQSSR